MILPSLVASEKSVCVVSVWSHFNDLMSRASRGRDVRETTYKVQGHVRVLERSDRGPVTMYLFC
jgi:hypothetical protein